LETNQQHRQGASKPNEEVGWETPALSPINREKAQISPFRVVRPAEQLNLVPGELIEVLSAREIMATLGVDGKLDGLPFMPEMLAFCGRRIRVARRADSTCWRGQPRRLESAVHLEQARCDGSAHNDCRASCLLLWKEAWLRRADGEADQVSVSDSIRSVPVAADYSCKYPLSGLAAIPDDDTMMCQATEIGRASCPLVLGSPPRFFFNVARDFSSRKLGITDLHRLGTYLRWKLMLLLFTKWASAPWNAGRFKKTPSQQLDLTPGEWVWVRSPSEILRTLDRNACNRGMEFKPEMFQFCGRKYRVLSKMQRRIDEHTSKMREFRNECIILDSVHCHGQRSFCARGNYHYWREIWLRRAEH
jgi:hypothetical protein